MIHFRLEPVELVLENPSQKAEENKFMHTDGGKCCGPEKPPADKKNPRTSLSADEEPASAG
jgi:hypothetical protein